MRPDVSDDRVLTGEGDEAESESFAVGANLLRVESDEMKTCKLLCRCAEDGRLADARPAGQEQRHEKG